MDLPNDIFVNNILLKLPVRSIISCKYVCKTWYNLISDPEFSKLHMLQAKTCILIRDIDRTLYIHSPSEKIYLMEPKDCAHYSFDPGYRSRDSGNETYNHYQEIVVKLNTKIKVKLFDNKVKLNNRGVNPATQAQPKPKLLGLGGFGFGLLGSKKVSSRAGPGLN
ncbi:F-box domain containing protein [Trema orientale]|uniref:F-box domain containing protein n=1 Tax=Trema orientale TaxID=63057 RepID=A0A2P5E9U2_TREOI|nr:F-box domain containing protein [Trema orientale]